MAPRLPPAYFLRQMAVLDNGFIPDGSDSDRGPVLDLDDVAVDAYWSFQNLATSHNSHVSGNALDVCLEYEFGFLRRRAQDMINLETTRLEGIFHASATTKAQKAKQAYRAAEVASALEEEFYDRIASYPYTIMPINTGEHWVAVLIGLEPRDGEDEDVYTHVRYITVMDPAQDDKSYAAVEAQLRRLLVPEDFTFENHPRRDIETVQQRDTHSCGLHVYQNIKTLMHRIEALRRAGAAWDDKRLWAPMDGKRFVAEKVRAKMRGIAAEVFLRDCGGLIRPVFVPTRNVIPHNKRTPVKAASILYPYSHYHPRAYELGSVESTGGGKRKRDTDALDQEYEGPKKPTKRGQPIKGGK